VGPASTTPPLLPELPLDPELLLLPEPPLEPELPLLLPEPPLDPELLLGPPLDPELPLLLLELWFPVAFAQALAASAWTAEQLVHPTQV
jgi:hypothetical protein